jgi:O-antigen ligase
MKPAKQNIQVDFFLLGLFLLLWATNAYAVFGNLGKYASLSLGILLLLTSVINIKIDLKILRIAFVSFYLLIFYILLSYLLDQETFIPLTISFNFVNLILFILGFILAERKKNEIKISQSVIIFISILSITSSYFYYIDQVSLNYDKGIRDLGDENLNAVGVAYVNAQLLILIIWFLLRKNSFFIKWLLIIASISILIVLLITESRGPILFLSLMLFLLFFKNIFKIIKFRNLLSALSLLLIILFITFNTPIIQNKIQSVTQRFAVLFISSSIKNIEDRSITARLDMQSDFFNNYDKMIFGKYNYTPYPHNQFLEIYMRWGVFGIPIFMISILSFINAIRFYREQKENKSSLNFLLLLLFVYCYLQSMTSLSLDNNRLLWLGFGFFINNYTSNSHSRFQINK